VVAPLLAALALGQAPVPFPHATSTSICGAKTIPYQQAAIAPATDGVWLACRDSRTLVRLTASGATLKTIKLGSFRPWAVASGGGAAWVISREVPQLLKVSPAGQVQRIALAGVPASLWFGAGSVWIGFESFGFQRINARTGRARTFFEGNGVSAFASDGATVYVISHRDNAITRVSLSTGRSRPLATGIVDVSKGAIEAAAFSNRSLWITGRGLDLLRVRPSTGKVQTVTDIGPAGFNVATSGGKIIVAGYSDIGARRGDPIVRTFTALDAGSGDVEATTTATGTAYLSGFFVSGRTIYAADTVQGRFVRVAVPAR
jgi:hypothetical protein